MALDVQIVHIKSMSTMMMKNIANSAVHLLMALDVQIVLPKSIGMAEVIQNACGVAPQALEVVVLIVPLGCMKNKRNVFRQ
jgi:hypothetical protein